MKQKKIALCVLMLGIGISSHAQQSINSAGGDASGGSGSVAYSIGQTFYSSSSSSTGSIEQGVQHATLSLMRELKVKFLWER